MCGIAHVTNRINYDIETSCTQIGKDRSTGKDSLDRGSTVHLFKQIHLEIPSVQNSTVSSNHHLFNSTGIEKMLRSVQKVNLHAG